MKSTQIFNKKNVFWLVFIIFFIIISAEIFGRVYLKILHKSVDPKFQFDYYRIYSLRPNFKEGDGKKNWIEVNAQGFRRSEDVVKKKPEKTFRVFLMGGSAAHGASSADPYPIQHLYNEETVDAYIEKMMQEKYPDYTIEIINAAITGYQVFQHTTYIISELIDYQPDLVIFLDGANDHYTNNPDFNFYADNRYQFWKHRLQSPSITGLLDYLFLFLSEYSSFAKGYHSWSLQQDAFHNSAVCDFVKNDDYSSIDSARIISQHIIAAQKQFLRNINLNLLILHDYNINALVCLQPLLCLRDTGLYSEAEKAFYKLYPYNNVLHAVLYPTIVKELDSLSQKHHVPFIDLMPFFNDVSLTGKQLFIDYAHYSNGGSMSIAKAIFPDIDTVFQKRMLLPQISSNSTLNK